MTISAYPLCWPPNLPRSASREKGAFKTSLPGALNNVQDSLRRFANDSDRDFQNLIISSNVTLGANRPEDAGVAVWFVWDGMSVCIAVDRYLSVEANLQAIHHIIEARRVELRHGTLALVRATFSGFAALPDQTGGAWWAVLGVSPDASGSAVRAAYSMRRSETHPDKGGSAEEFTRVTEAWKSYLRTKE